MQRDTATAFFVSLTKNIFVSSPEKLKIKSITGKSIHDRA